jgi:hypothetical protein
LDDFFRVVWVHVSHCKFSSTKAGHYIFLRTWFPKTLTLLLGVRGHDTRKIPIRRYPLSNEWTNKSPTSSTQQADPIWQAQWQTQSEVKLKMAEALYTMAEISPVHHQGLNPRSFSWGVKLSERAIPVSHHPWISGISSGFLQNFHLCSQGSHDCKIYVSSFYMEQHMTVHLLLLLNSLHETNTCFPHPSSLPKLEHNAKEVSIGLYFKQSSYKKLAAWWSSYLVFL